MSVFIWPFRTKSTAQYRRIDQGWDLQGQGPGEEECLAIADGVVVEAHDPGGGGAHFGDPYPVLQFTVPVDGIPAAYYGHTHPAVSAYTHVKQGDVIAHTSTPGGGGVSAPHWLEIGAWRNGPTGNGQWMYDKLIGAPVFAPPEPPEDDVPYIVKCTDPNHSPAQYAVVSGIVVLIQNTAELQAMLHEGYETKALPAGVFDGVAKHAGE